MTDDLPPGHEPVDPGDGVRRPGETEAERRQRVQYKLRRKARKKAVFPWRTERVLLEMLKEAAREHHRPPSLYLDAVVWKHLRELEKQREEGTLSTPENPWWKQYDDR